MWLEKWERWYFEAQKDLRKNEKINIFTETKCYKRELTNPESIRKIVSETEKQISKIAKLENEEVVASSSWCFCNYFAKRYSNFLCNPHRVEIFEDLADVDSVFVAVGGGGLIGGIAAYLKSVKPGIKVKGLNEEGKWTFFLNVHRMIRESHATLLVGFSIAGGYRRPTTVCWACNQALVFGFCLAAFFSGHRRLSHHRPPVEKVIETKTSALDEKIWKWRENI